MKVYQMISTDEAGTIEAGTIFTDKNEISGQYYQAVREWTADNLELNEASSSPVDPSLSYEDVMEMEFSEVRQLMSEILEGKGTDMTSFVIEEKEVEFSELTSIDIIDKIEAQLVARWKQHALISEVDFLVGAMAAMTAVEDKPAQLWSHAPPFWIFSAISNRSVVGAVLQSKGEEEMAKRAQAQDDLFTRRYHKLNDMVAFLHGVIHNTRSGLTYNEKIEAREFIRGTAIHLLEEMGEEWRVDDEEA